MPRERDIHNPAPATIIVVSLSNFRGFFDALADRIRQIVSASDVKCIARVPARCLNSFPRYAG